MRAIIGAVAIAALGLPVLAQSLPTGREAQRMLFSPRGQAEGVVIPHESLNAAEIALLGGAIDEGLLPDMLYYGALAIAPDAGLANPATTAAVGNYHDEAAARDAALAQCEAGREEGADCVVVLVVRPRGWEPGAALQLSASASAVLRGDYRRADRPKVFAISPATGAWGIGDTETSANAACGQADCRAVIAD
ncbi:5-aminolevulic acid synthase [Rhodophyticola porphyridii]|uniref:5-aminolevulic acid synthase n=1 Tax=Rhodophyticola porphyridii TaxID=1852017 RepID=A0A3L9XZK0_9RHOB|nr:5-aminolevulic acid synthase [Rhodophyticola porphyridii]RMA41969.1 5-aminolevulic acid synthase [Rhodophyticola porphyridii]